MELIFCFNQKLWSKAPILVFFMPITNPYENTHPAAPHQLSTENEFTKEFHKIHEYYLFYDPVRNLYHLENIISFDVHNQLNRNCDIFVHFLECWNFFFILCCEVPTFQTIHTLYSTLPASSLSVSLYSCPSLLRLCC